MAIVIVRGVSTKGRGGDAQTPHDCFHPVYFFSPSCSPLKEVEGVEAVTKALIIVSVPFTSLRGERKGERSISLRGEHEGERRWIATTIGGVSMRERGGDVLGDSRERR
ncbi:hypothetical protein GW17_00044552 [Ensete ventricosum]|nr:hypothetical protein GW17_00044552 [Ensete ventricosum]